MTEPANLDNSPNETVEIVQPTEDNVRRLWSLYQQAYLNDDDLLARVVRSDIGIDGLTEPMTCDELAAAMQMTDTVTLEAMAAEDPTNRGFVIIRYASKEPESKRAFKEYFLSEVFSQDALHFRSREDESNFLALLERGDMLYFAEFVSKGGRRITGALIRAVFEKVCLDRLSATSTVLGKCLDAVQIGPLDNSIGNRPVKALAESLGLQKIARCDQIRTVLVPGQFDLTEDNSHGMRPGDTVGAVLTFAMYCGDAGRATELLSSPR